MPRIFQRGNKFGIDYTAHGIRYREVVGTNRKLAEIALSKKIALIAENKFLDIRRREQIRLSDLIEKYKRLHLCPNVRSWERAEGHNLKHLEKYFAGRYLHEITPMLIEQFRLERLKFVSKASVNKNVGCLRAMFNKAIEWGIYSGKNPVQSIKPFKTESQRTRYLDKEEIPRLFKACEPEQWLRDIVEFALNTGMRRGEIFNLKWHDIDFKQGIIYLLRTKNNEKREVPISDVVRDVLYRVRKHPDSPLVFCREDGSMRHDDLKKPFSRALERAGIGNFRFHDLRHTFASQLAMAGVELFTIKELLGHKSIDMTMRYSHLSCDHKKRAVQALCNRIAARPAPVPESMELIPELALV